MQLSYDPAITCLDINLRKNENGFSHKTCTWIFGATLFITAPAWKQPRCPSAGDWLNKAGHPYHGISDSNKQWRKDGFIQQLGWSQIIMLSEKSQPSKATYCMIPFTWCSWREETREKGQMRCCQGPGMRQEGRLSKGDTRDPRAHGIILNDAKYRIPLMWQNCIEQMSKTGNMWEAMDRVTVNILAMKLSFSKMSPLSKRSQVYMGSLCIISCNCLGT